MTNEEIEKIAREYIKEVYNGDTDFIDEAENIIQWLSKNYCIVLKEQVKTAYKMEMQAFGSTNEPSAAHIFKGRALLLEALFGKDMFEKERK